MPAVAIASDSGRSTMTVQGGSVIWAPTASMF
jgi:hypothetical protein